MNRRFSILFFLASALLILGCPGAAEKASAPNRPAAPSASLSASQPQASSRPPAPAQAPEIAAAFTDAPKRPSPYAEGPIEPRSEPAPNLIELDLPGGPDVVNPSEEEHALALIQEDEWNRALPCPREGRADKQTAGEDIHRCAYRHTNTIVLSKITLWLGAVRTSHEHDGMYGLDDEIAIMIPHKEGIRVIHTLTQWSEDVSDCASTLSYRRHRVMDLNGDGAQELCIESVSEQGVGLFYVMDLEEAKQLWKPLGRARRIEAYRLNHFRFKIERAADLDKACPRQGYSLFVNTPLYPDALAYRRNIQGDSPKASCPKGPVQACFGLTELCPQSPH